MKEGGQVRECIRVFLSVLSGIAGLYGICNSVSTEQPFVFVYIAALFTINYWLCFYRFQKLK
jgi:hypothetical protein